MMQLYWKIKSNKKSSPNDKSPKKSQICLLTSLCHQKLKIKRKNKSLVDFLDKKVY
ncbi:hypothetical protein Bca4012_019856 [Brassica carinata]